jgi:hypothetical protein
MATLFAVLAAVLFLARLALFVALHVVPSDYDPVRHAVSDYAVGRTRTLSTAMTWTTALAWAVLAVAVVGTSWDEKAEVLWQLVPLVALFIALPFLPTDLEGQRATTVGRLHLLAAIAWFALSYSLTGNFSRYLADAGVLGTALVVLHWVALASLVALIASLVVQPLRRRAFGISERVFIVAINLFFLLASVGLATT